MTALNVEVKKRLAGCQLGRRHVRGIGAVERRGGGRAGGGQGRAGAGGGEGREGQGGGRLGIM